MNYGNPKVAAGGTLVLTGMTLGEQFAIVGAALLIIITLAVALRKNWRKGKQLSDQ